MQGFLHTHGMGMKTREIPRYTLVAGELRILLYKVRKPLMKKRYLGSNDDWKSDSSVLAILLMLGSIMAIFLTGCSAQRKTQLITGPTMTEMPALSTDPTVTQTFMPFATGASETHSIVSNLTRSKWQRVRTQDPNLASEIVTWEFYSNGMFRWQFTSDFSETNIGAWAISPTSEEDGVMFLASTTNDLSKIDVLSLKFENEQLVLGEFSYQETPFTSADAPPDIFEKARQAVTDRREDVFSLWISVTSSDWRSESAPAPGDPDSYSFMQDGIYAARFDSTECEYAGTWSTSFSGGDSGVIWLSVPANACDSRGPQDTFVREMPTRLDGDKLILSETIYSPVPK